MQSADYVPGVSGWKIEKGLIEMNGGPHGPVRIGDAQASEKVPSDEQLAALCLTKQDLAEPSIVVDGVTYINQALVSDDCISVAITDEVSARASPDETLASCIDAEEALKAAIADWTPGLALAVPSVDHFSVRMTKNRNGHYVCAGIGVGLSDFEKAKAQGFSTAQEYLASFIAGSQLSSKLFANIEKIGAGDESVQEAIRSVIREEIKPGGMLHSARR